jgi:hypothetical protein
MTTVSGEEAFRQVFAWVQAGSVTDEYDGTPYRWKREGHTATHMRQSPAGEYYAIMGPLTAYLRPGKREPLDFRGATTVEMLIDVAKKLTT